ncbi:hypothetical protein ACJJI4_22615 [Microbulbifer sp. TRSA002]|uniref:hypothetical protein n=1 Tax=Microbulbifer sp. TRSA002 TaxID=3243382 RepID=UPI004039D52A
MKKYTPVNANDYYLADVPTNSLDVEGTSLLGERLGGPGRSQAASHPVFDQKAFRENQELATARL